MPSKILAAAHISPDSSISIEVKGRKIIIEEIAQPKVRRLNFPFSEQLLLEGLTPDLAHADDIAVVFDSEFGE